MNLAGLARSWETEADEIDTGPGDPVTFAAAKTLRECAAELRLLPSEPRQADAEAAALASALIADSRDPHGIWMQTGPSRGSRRPQAPGRLRWLRRLAGLRLAQADDPAGWMCRRGDGDGDDC